MKVTILRFVLELLGRFPFIAKACPKLPNLLKRSYSVFIPAFTHTSVSKQADISMLTSEVNILRDKLGIKLIPGFYSNVRHDFNKYVLKTISNSIENGDLHFGERIIISAEIGDIDKRETRFSLLFKFCYDKQVISTIEQQIYYIDNGGGNVEKEKFFNCIRIFSTDNCCNFSTYDIMKQFIRYRNRTDYVFEYEFIWYLGSTTEARNTKNESYINFLQNGLEDLLLRENQGNIRLLESGEIKMDKLYIYYLSDFHYQQASFIRYFKERYDNIVAVFIAKEPSGKGAAFARFHLIQS